MLKPATAVTMEFQLNGKPEQAEVPAGLTLVDFLRTDCGLKGVKLSCSRAVCGACTVLIDGNPYASCSVFAFQVDGKSVQTIEGMTDADGKLHHIQEAFIKRSAFQCGYCTSGMIMLTKALLDTNPQPTKKDIVDWISSNVCRCTGYAMIIDAVTEAAATIRTMEVSRG